MEKRREKIKGMCGKHGKQEMKGQDEMVITKKTDRENEAERRKTKTKREREEIKEK